MPNDNDSNGAAVPTGRAARLWHFGGMATGIADSVSAGGLRALAEGKRPDLASDFEAGTLADAILRVGAEPMQLQAGDPAALAKWATAAGATQIATPYITQGPLRDWLDEAAPSLALAGISLCEWRRDWDAAIWPHATAGFFKVKQNIPRILEQALLA